MTRRHEGAGLGLAISKSLAELHGGELLIDSRPKQGTTVRLRLPAGRVLATGTGDDFIHQGGTEQ